MHPHTNQVSVSYNCNNICSDPGTFEVTDWELQQLVQQQQQQACGGQQNELKTWMLLHILKHGCLKHIFSPAALKTDTVQADLLFGSDCVKWCQEISCCWIMNYELWMNYDVTVKLAFDLWPSNLNQFILGSWWTFVSNLKELPQIVLEMWDREF